LDRVLPSGFKDKYGKLWYNGLPYKGPVLDIKESDPAAKLPVHRADIHIKEFWTDKPEDLKEWIDICQRKADGVIEISFEDKLYDADRKAWHILIRWLEYYYSNGEI
jgi:hypothetical protein